MSKQTRKLIRWGRWLPLLALYQSLGCLPDNAIRQVIGESFTQTAALLIQSFTATIFGGLLGT